MNFIRKLFAPNDSVVIVSKQEWEDLKADVRGLKKLVELEENRRVANDQGLANAIDILERRQNAQADTIGMLAQAVNRNATAAREPEPVT